MATCTQPAAVAAQPTSNASIDIVLVEDETAFRSLIECCFLRAGYTIATFSDGRSALEFLSRHRARLVITDIYMPEGDGFELLSNLRNTHPDLSSIVMSGRSVGDHELFLKAAWHLGARYTFKKPFPLGDLLTAARDVIGPAMEANPA